MSQKIISIVIGLVLTLGVGVLVYANKKPPYVPPFIPKETPSPIPVVSTPKSTNVGGEVEDGAGTVTKTPVTTPTPTPAPKPAVSGITLAQVAEHNSRSSCWSAINGNVYDLTSWIPNHPGGEQNILRICGIDGSDAYNGQHGGSRRTASILAGFKLDVLAN